jgi:hypothetical protein
MDEQQRLLAGIPGEGVAEPLLQKPDQVLVPARDLLEKAVPAGTVRGLGRSGSGDPGRVVLASGGA